MRPRQTLNRYVVAACLSLPLLLPAPAPARAQNHQRLVEEVVVQGNRRLRAEDIFSRLRTRPGHVFRERQVRRDLRTLLEWGVFDAARTSVTIEAGVRGGVVVIFDVHELPAAEPGGRRDACLGRRAVL